MFVHIMLKINFMHFNSKYFWVAFYSKHSPKIVSLQSRDIGGGVIKIDFTLQIGYVVPV